VAHCARGAGGGLAPAATAAARVVEAGSGLFPAPTVPAALVAVTLRSLLCPSLRAWGRRGGCPGRGSWNTVQPDHPPPQERAAGFEELVGVKQIARREGAGLSCPHSWSQRWGTSGGRRNFEGSGSRGLRVASSVLSGFSQPQHQ
jgi:hypothetical protein